MGGAELSWGDAGEAEQRPFGSRTGLGRRGVSGAAGHARRPFCRQVGRRRYSKYGVQIYTVARLGEQVRAQFWLSIRASVFSLRNASQRVRDLAAGYIVRRCNPGELDSAAKLNREGSVTEVWQIRV